MNKLTVEEAGARKVSLHSLEGTLIVSDGNLGERTLEMAVAEIAGLDPDDDYFPDDLEEQMSRVMDLAHDIPVSSLDFCSPEDWTDPDKHYNYYE